MSIIDTITDEYRFWNWLKQSGSYQNNFSLEGSKAVFNYFNNLSEELGEHIEFDPIAWCVEFTEYANLQEVQDNYTDIETLEDLQDRTTVLELDNGGLVIAEF